MARKTALYFAPLPATFRRLCETIERQSWLQMDAAESASCWRGTNLTLCIDLATTVAEAVERLRGHYYNAILVDCRHLPEHSDQEAARQEEELLEFLAAVGTEGDRERRYPFRRIAALVGDPNRERVDRLVFKLGQKHIGACLRDRSLNDGLLGDEEWAARGRLAEQLWQFCSAILVEKPRGKKAICGAGGGITGVFYELGVLKCLNDALRGMDVRDFDLYFGISAGAFVTSFLANNFHIDDLIAQFGGLRDDGSQKQEIRWGHLNLREVPRRLGIVQKSLLAQLREMARSNRGLPMTSWLDSYALPFGPMFNNDDLERNLRQQFSRPKHSNDFRKLARRLYIGVSDQDRREHVLLGSEGYEDVPVSLAVQASAAIHPFFPPVKIHGRYYTDGAVTRTSNLSSAIEYGADLIFIIDPFVPLISEEPGLNARHGNLWVMQQDIKTLAYTRFAQVSEELLRRNPHVSCYTFVPSNRMRALMAQNPLAAENFHPILVQAYSSTYRRLSQLEYKVAGELESHGLQLDLKPVADKVEKLERHLDPDASLLL
jgi:predicted acylesterase/phospholipase RssA